jgi:hypothetical protein
MAHRTPPPALAAFAGHIFASSLSALIFIIPQSAVEHATSLAAGTHSFTLRTACCCGLSVFILHPPPVYLSPRALELGQPALNAAPATVHAVRAMKRMLLQAGREMTVLCAALGASRRFIMPPLFLISFSLGSCWCVRFSSLSLLSHFWKTNPLWHSKALSFVRKFSHAGSEKSAMNIIFAFQN